MFIYGEFLAPLETTEPTFKLVLNSNNIVSIKDKCFEKTKDALVHQRQTGTDPPPYHKHSQTFKESQKLAHH